MTGVQTCALPISVKFGPNGQINSLEPPVFQIQGAEPVVLFPKAIKQGDLKLGVD